jgi:hypothetical protein
VVKELLKQYFDLQEQIYHYFGYEGDWTVLPIEDNSNNYWFVTSDKVVYSCEIITEQSIEEGSIIYSAEIDKNGIYRESEFTLIVADTRTDGNKFLMIFDNSKEQKDNNLEKVYKECW